jgi:hypothetical protein
MKIIDYSLLAGVYKVENFSSAMVDLTNCKTLKSTTVILTQSEIYFVGIIDILTLYDRIKSTEHNLKSIIHDSKKISAVPPLGYKERFCSFIESCLE